LQIKFPQSRHSRCLSITVSPDLIAAVPLAIATQSQLDPPVDEFVRQDISMPGLLDLEDLDDCRMLLSPDAPDAVASDGFLEV
jgi:hypothetical protein